VTTTHPKTKLRTYLPYITVTKNEVAYLERGIENMSDEEATKVVADLEAALAAVGPAIDAMEAALKRSATFDAMETAVKRGAEAGQ
jgi:hypothetical protein